MLSNVTKSRRFLNWLQGALWPFSSHFTFTLHSGPRWLLTHLCCALSCLLWNDADVTFGLVCFQLACWSLCIQDSVWWLHLMTEWYSTLYRYPVVFIHKLRELGSCFMSSDILNKCSQFFAWNSVRSSLRIFGPLYFLCIPQTVTFVHSESSFYIVSGVHEDSSFSTSLPTLVTFHFL